MTTFVRRTASRQRDDEGGSTSFRTGSSELLVGVLVGAIGGFLLVRTAAMDVPSSVSFLGPRFFPTVVGTLLVALGISLAVRATLAGHRTRTVDAASEEHPGATHSGSDRKPLLLTAASLVVHLALLRTAGWIVAGALLFWGVSCALGSEHRLRDLGISVIVSSAVQLAFSAGLGLSLPSGLLLEVL
ncbi:tripartite tricarboxylate transporter TctB family protein [Actinopolyspora erythraea]|uniref:Tripartite tricarboxylate transporter TctB family protein n=1 Tax=Actinopolyspora erythraea TaxID=414996 RepID=A0A223RPZ0_9ACTN|nr:tripartite tricarboxylate transporter TctB family protein [Actinopolyspora erythraea]ASU77875.1 tripartite tricarboxylate transporter TctB family protein [Actinopolyspora erythraea]